MQTSIKRRLYGFSLIELVVTMGVLLTLLAIAMPNYARWLSNQRIRAQAESVQAGLLLARSEAIKRNTTVRFQLVDALTASCADSNNGRSWVVSVFPAAGLCNVTPDPITVSTDSGFDATLNPLILQAQNLETSSSVLVNAGAAQICFNGMGQLSSAAGCAAGPINIALTSSGGDAACVSNGGDDRCMRTQVSAGGLVRMCDPAVTQADDPRRCE